MTGEYRLDLNQFAHAKRMLAHQLAPLVEAAAVILKDEIRLVMEEASPSGRTYPIPGTGASYRASAPGEPPAIREAHYRDSWKNTPAVVLATLVLAAAYSDLRVGKHGEYLLGDLLQHGTHDLVNYRVRMEPRPHIEEAMERARVKIERLITGTAG